MNTKQFIKKIYTKEIDHFFILDTETTGLSIYEDGIIQASVIEIKGGKVINTFESLYNPGKYISPFIENLTGISNEAISRKKEIQKDKKLIKFLGKSGVIVAHNASFDKGILLGNGVEFAAHEWIDSVYILKVLFPNEEKYKLDLMVDKYGKQSPYYDKRHNALNDVYNLAYVLKKGYEEISDIDKLLERKIGVSNTKSTNVKEEYHFKKKHMKESLSGKVVCFTGSLKVSRAAMVELIESNGAKWSKGVTGKVDLLIVGVDAGSKLDQAKSKGIEVVYEDEFEQMIN